MKKFLLLALLLFMTSCDFGTESKKDVPNVPPKDTTKVLVQKTVVVNDTNISKTHTLNISGKLSEKNSSGNLVGAFSSAVVCLESSKKCVKPNSTGLYSFAAPKTSSLYGARSLAQSDTTVTPEGIVPSILPDTVIKIESDVVYDTIIKNDTIYQIQTYHIVRNVYIDSDTARNDSVIVYSNSRILYEIPVTSWKSILPEKYVVQRNISGKIAKNAYTNETESAEAIYWSVDSIALRIPLELSNDKRVYSGFVYQPYDDSSFAFKIKNKNLFVRIVDGNDSVFGISNVVNFSERAGDLSIFLDSIVPGNVLRYPRPNVFRVITEGQNIIRILNDTTIRANNSWYDFDSISSRKMFEYSVLVDSAGGWYSMNYMTNPELLKIANIDSISFRFVSNNKDTAKILVSPSSVKNQIMYVDSGVNVLKIPFNSVSQTSKTMIGFEINKLDISDVKTFVKFK